MDEGHIRPITSPTLQNAVYAHLRELIVTGKLAPGTRLKEQRLSELLGVSRSPIREAIVQLARDGLVTTKARNGDFVTWYTPTDVREIYDVRLAIEMMAMRRAVPKLTDAQLHRLEEAAAACTQALEAGDIPLYGAKDQLFHFTLVDLAGNRRLSEIMRQLGGQIQAIRAFVALNIERVRRAEEEHQRILECIRRRSVDEALSWLSRHIESVSDEVSQIMERHSRQAEADPEDD